MVCIAGMCLTGCIYVFGEPFDGYGYSGTILYADGTPARDIRAFVTARKLAATEVGQRLSSFDVAVTDDQGVFRGSFHTMGQESSRSTVTQRGIRLHRTAYRLLGNEA